MECPYPAFQVGLAETVRKVTAAEDFVVPGNSEMLVDVFIERDLSDDSREDCSVLIEPSEHFKDNYPLVMASSIADVKHNVTHKVRLINPFSQEFSVKQDAVIGSAEHFQNEENIVLVENETDIENLSTLRRIQIVRTEERKSVKKRDKIRRVKESSIEAPQHLHQLYSKASENLNKEQSRVVLNTLQQYGDVFSKHEFDLGLTSLTEHTIDVGNHRPIKQAPRRVPTAFADEEERIIKQMEEQGIIRPSTSPWASPIVLVRKKSGKIRPCVDYRRLNAVTIKDAFPLPRVSDCLDAVAGSTLFSCFDVTSGYHQIPVRDTDIPKTTFCTKYGLYEYTSMPMGLTNSPATFQRLMEIALRGLQWHTCLIYLDDIVVFGNNFEEHLKRVEEVLQRLQFAGLKLKPEK